MKEEHLCRCGKPLKPEKVEWSDRIFWPLGCDDCVEEIKKELKEEREQEEYKQQQAQELECRKKCIAAILPRRYESACLDDLPKRFREQLYEKFNKTERKGAYLYGEPGRGKTYALCAVLRDLITRGHQVRRVVWERLTFDIRASIKSEFRDVTEKTILQPLLDCDVLIIEDVGTTTRNERAESDFNLRVFLMILDYRNENMKPTFISSNKSVEQLARTFDDRVASRIYEHCEVILLKGKDRRRK